MQCKQALLYDFLWLVITAAMCTGLQRLIAAHVLHVTGSTASCLHRHGTSHVSAPVGCNAARVGKLGTATQGRAERLLTAQVIVHLRQSNGMQGTAVRATSTDVDHLSMCSRNTCFVPQLAHIANKHMSSHP